MPRGVRRHQVNTPRPMSIAAWSTPWWKGTIHSHTACISITAYRPMAMEIFHTPNTVSLCPIPISIRGLIARTRRHPCICPIPVRTSRRDARCRCCGFRTRGEGHVIPDTCSCPVDARGAGFWGRLRRTASTTSFWDCSCEFAEGG
jgi:hypothetical protein